MAEIEPAGHGVHAVLPAFGMLLTGHVVQNVAPAELIFPGVQGLHEPFE